MLDLMDHINHHLMNTGQCGIQRFYSLYIYRPCLLINAEWQTPVIIVTLVSILFLNNSECICFCLQMISECRVCNEIFRFQGDKVPRLLVCGHTVCHQCLTRLPLHGRTLLCPFDRQPTETGDSGVWGLKKNFALLELLEKLQNPQQTPCRILSDSILAREQSVRLRHHCAWRGSH